MKRYHVIVFFIVICALFGGFKNNVYANLENNVKVSVILPICNNDNVYLSECLDSLVNQTQEEIEIICINYGSTNNNDKILEEYARKDSRIIVVEQKNKESSVAKNKGLELAKGEYITFVDANSYMDLNSYDWAYQIVKRNDDDVLEFGIRCFLDEDESGKTEKLYRPRRDRPYKVENIDEIIDEFYEVYITNKLYKRSFLEENNIRFMEQNVYEDVCFSYMVMPYIKNYQTRKNCFCNYKKECDSIVKKSTSNLDIDKCINTINMVCREWEKVNIINKNGEYLLKKLVKPYYRKFESIIEVDNTYNDRFLEALGTKICSKEVLDKYDALTKCLILKLKNNNGVKEKCEEPKISVILPIYNVEPWLRDCLDTLTNQTFEDIEIICVNDGSTDNSDKILEEYAKKDKRIIVITQENQGLSAARNSGLKIASGEYISFIDPDDYIELETYQVIYNLAKKNNDDLLIFGRRVFLDITNEIIGYSTPAKDAVHNLDIDIENCESPEEKAEKSLEYIKNLENDFGECAVTSKLYKKDFLSRYNIKFVPGMIYEDNCFNIMVMPHVKRYETITNNFFNNRTRRGSITAIGRNNKNLDKCIYAINVVCDEWERANKLEGNEDYILSTLLKHYGWIYETVIMKDKSLADKIKEAFGSKIYNEEVISRCEDYIKEGIIDKIEKISMECKQSSNYALK